MVLLAARFVDDFVPSITPDMWLETDDEGNYIVKMEEAPTRSLYISKHYRKTLANGLATPEEKEFIKRKIMSAQWLIESIEQRRSTLTRVAQEIVKHQKTFFDNGPEFLKPLKMDQIASIVKVAVYHCESSRGPKMDRDSSRYPATSHVLHGGDNNR